ncbi:MAG: hypothetical protein WBK96_01635 [Candidatus Manganitrophaceae bacterium]
MEHRVNQRVNMPGKQSLLAICAILVSSLIIGVTSAINLLLPFTFVFSSIFVLLYLCFEKGMLICFGLFLIVQELLVLNVGQESHVGVFLKRLDETVILTFFVILLAKQCCLRLRLTKTSVNFLVLGVCLIGFLSSIYKDVPFHVAGFDLFLILKGFLLFYIFSALRYEEADVRLLSRIFFITGVVIVLLGLIDFISPEKFRSAIGNQSYVHYQFGIPSIQSIFVHPGLFGWFTALLACYSFAFYCIYRNQRSLFLASFFTLVMLLSMRRKPIAGLLVAVVFTLFVFWPYLGKGRIRIALATIISMGGIGFLFFEKIMGIIYEGFNFYLSNPDPMSVARNALYITSFTIAGDYFPLGVGLGRFGGWVSSMYYSPVYREYGLDSVYGLSPDMPDFISDTFWPHILGELGVAGVIVYSFILLALFRIPWQFFKRGENPFIKAFALGTMMVFIEALVESVAHPIYEMSLTGYFVFGSIGVLNAVRRESSSPLSK